MPVLNVRVQAKGQETAGKHGGVPLGTPLIQAGPRLQVTLSPLKEQAQAANGGNGASDMPIVGQAVIDTGSSATCFDRKAATKAGLVVSDSGPLHSATHADEMAPIYAGSLLIHGPNINLQTHRAYGIDLEKQGLIALIGRDVLSKCILVYNGPDSSFSLSV